MEEELVPAEQEDCASVLKVLADDTRLAAIEQLMDGPMHVGQINEVLNIEQSLLSHHLRVLRDAGLVEATRDGKRVLYSLAKNVVGKGKGKGKAIHLGCCKISFD